MPILALSLSLLWRTAGAVLLLAVLFMPILAMLELVGIELPPSHLQSTVTYIYAKPSVIYAALAAGILLFEQALRISLHKALWGSRLCLSSNGWSLVTRGVVFLLLTLAVLNVLVALTTSASTYVNYKLYGGIGILIVGHLVLAYAVRANAASEALPVAEVEHLSKESGDFSVEAEDEDSQRCKVRSSITAECDRDNELSA